MYNNNNNNKFCLEFSYVIRFLFREYLSKENNNPCINSLIKEIKQCSKKKNLWMIRFREPHVCYWTSNRKSDAIQHNNLQTKYNDNNNNMRNDEVYYVVDLDQAIFYQQCTNTDCKKKIKKEFPRHRDTHKIPELFRTTNKNMYKTFFDFEKDIDDIKSFVTKLIVKHCKELQEHLSNFNVCNAYIIQDKNNISNFYILTDILVEKNKKIKETNTNDYHKSNADFDDIHVRDSFLYFVIEKSKIRIREDIALIERGLINVTKIKKHNYFQKNITYECHKKINECNIENNNNNKNNIIKNKILCILNEYNNHNPNQNNKNKRLHSDLKKNDTKDINIYPSDTREILNRSYLDFNYDELKRIKVNAILQDYQKKVNYIVLNFLNTLNEIQ